MYITNSNNVDAVIQALESLACREHPSDWFTVDEVVHVCGLPRLDCVIAMNHALLMSVVEQTATYSHRRVTCYYRINITEGLE